MAVTAVTYCPLYGARVAHELRETVLFQTPLEIHPHEVWTEMLSEVSISQDITDLYISDALSCVLGSVFGRLWQSWQCKVSFSLLVVAKAIAYMNEFQS